MPQRIGHRSDRIAPLAELGCGIDESKYPLVLVRQLIQFLEVSDDANVIVAEVESKVSLRLCLADTKGFEFAKVLLTLDV
jgi:hypothetical protein